MNFYEFVKENGPVTAKCMEAQGANGGLLGTVLRQLIELGMIARKRMRSDLSQGRPVYHYAVDPALFDQLAEPDRWGRTIGANRVASVEDWAAVRGVSRQGAQYDLGVGVEAGEVGRFYIGNRALYHDSGQDLVIAVLTRDELAAIDRDVQILGESQ